MRTAIATSMRLTTSKMTRFAAALGAVAILGACASDDRGDSADPGPGAEEHEASIDVLGARVVSDSHREGRVIGALVNNAEETAELNAIEGVGEDDDVVVAMQPVRIGGDDHVNLAEDPILRASGSFSAGEFVRLRFLFSTGESVTLNVPVVKECKYYRDVHLHDESEDEDSTGDTYVCATELEVPPGGGYLDESAEVTDP